MSLPLPQGFEFEKTIDATDQNAEVMQALILQDLKSAGIDQPWELANPGDSYKVEAQLRKLRAHPERYCGVTRNGRLVAFSKQNNWFVGDELPFATGFRAIWLKVRRALRLNRMAGQWGVFGLVVLDGLSGDDQDAIFTCLLESSFKDAQGRPRTVNIIDVGAYGRLPRTLRDHGFTQVGRPGEAAGVPGTKQWRYRRLASS